MATPKHEQFFMNMIAQNQELFDQFREVHTNYTKDPKKYQKQFNQIGADILDIARRYENMLCNSTESSKFNKFSTNLSEKFQAHLKSAFPKINFIGLED